MNAEAKKTPYAAPPLSNIEGRTVTDHPDITITVKTKFEPTHSQRELGSDAFSYYSNKFYWMKTVLMKGDDVQVLRSAGITFQGPATKRRKGSNAQPVQIQDGGVRQTRLAFEVHPSLLIYDDLIRMFEQRNCADISDDDDQGREEVLDKVLDANFLLEEQGSGHISDDE
jgi:hypothetical protein